MVMTPEDAAAAGLAGLDSGELITIPSLADSAVWQSSEDARLKIGRSACACRAYPALRRYIG